MAVLFSNNAATTLATSVTTGATSITVATGTGALFPSITSPDFFCATLVDASNNIEIIKVTGRATDTLTIVRAQEGTSARAYASGDKIELRVTAAGLSNKLDKDTGGTLGGKLVTLTPSSAAAGLNLPNGTAPASPVNGDVWTTSTGFFARLGGVTYTLSYAALTETLTNKTIDTASSNTIKINGNTLSASAGSATFSFPGTVSDTLVSLTASQTLTNKTLTSPTVNGGTVATASLYASNTVTDSGTIAVTSPGFRGIPQNEQTSSYTLALTDAGKHISTIAGVAIPANASVAFPVGSTIVLYNNSAAAQSVTISTDLLRLAGSTSTGTRSLAAYGLATLLKVGTQTWVISGNVT